MSPTDDLFSTGYPGGIYNNGFAAELDQRPHRRRQAGRHLCATARWSSLGDPRLRRGPALDVLRDRRRAGRHERGLVDVSANQALHGQSEDLGRLVGPQLVAPGTGPGRDPSLFDRRSMVDWAAHVTVPVFLSGALQDEQTGPQWPALIERSPRRRRSSPTWSTAATSTRPIPRRSAAGSSSSTSTWPTRCRPQPGLTRALVLDRFAAYASATLGAGAAARHPLHGRARTSTVARADFATQTPRVRVLFDSGAGAVGSGRHRVDLLGRLPQLAAGGRGHEAATSGRAERWRPPSPRREATAPLQLDPSVRPATSLPPGGNPWAADPPGTGRRSRRRRDRLPDGTLHDADHDRRAGHPGPVGEVGRTGRGLPGHHHRGTAGSRRRRSTSPRASCAARTRSTPRTRRRSSPIPPTCQGDARDLSADRYSLVKIPIDPIVHTFRPGRTCGWSCPHPEATVRSGRSTRSTRASRPRSVSVAWPRRLRGQRRSGCRTRRPTLPACGSLRGEPCRAYVPESNQQGS